MLSRANYCEVVLDGWRLSVQTQLWSKSLERQVLGLVARQAAARHPQTLQLDFEMDTHKKAFFIKVFHRTSRLAYFKDCFRQTKAIRFLRQGLALEAAGFNVPVPITVGVELGWGIAKREFILSEKIDGAPLLKFLRDLQLGNGAAVIEKRKSIARLAQLIRQFHDNGFVHGDLVATNIFLSKDNAGETIFYFMDNDRTKRYPSWLPQKLWQRNLLQLNRLPLAGISLQDRMRFFHAYLGVSRLSDVDRRLAHWLETRTRQRRKECDGADPNQDFRKLMRWGAETPGVKSV